MRFSPEGIPNCGADVATWTNGVVDPESKFKQRTGDAEFGALVSCFDSCPLNNLELPNSEFQRVSELQLQALFEAKCPMVQNFALTTQMPAQLPPEFF